MRRLLGGVNHDRPAALMFVPSVSNGPRDMQIIDDPREVSNSLSAQAAKPRCLNAILQLDPENEDATLALLVLDQTRPTS